MPAFIDLTGRRFGRLTVLDRAPIKDRRGVYWHCRCDCGIEKSVRSYSLIRGETRSCGCLSIEQATQNLQNSSHRRKHTNRTRALWRQQGWEADWNRIWITTRPSGTKFAQVWARNPRSDDPDAREWHWVRRATLTKCGIKWQRPRNFKGRYPDSHGYIIRLRLSLTPSEIALCDELGLWRHHGASSIGVLEHRLEAAKKYGAEIIGKLVRHKNGHKDDNRWDNLLLGTDAENKADHATAQLDAITWRARYEAEHRRVRHLLRQLKQLESRLIDVSNSQQLHFQIGVAYREPAER